MQIKESIVHNRTLDVSEIPSDHPSEPKELQIAIAYMGDGSASKGVTLDGKILPFILKAVETYNQLLALKAAGQLEVVRSLATDNMVDPDDEDMEEEAEIQSEALEGFVKLVESL